jgi:hypothetical protein
MVDSWWTALLPLVLLAVPALILVAIVIGIFVNVTRGSDRPAAHHPAAPPDDEGLKRLASLRDVYLFLVMIYAVCAVGVGGALITPHIPPVSPDAPTASRVLFVAVTFPGEVAARVLPASVVAVLGVALLIWLAQFAMAVATPVHRRLLTPELARARGISEAEAEELLRRLPRRVRWREAIHISRALLIIGAIYAVAGVLLALVGWVVVLIVNLSLATAVHIVMVVVAVIGLILFGQVVLGVTDVVIKGESADETYARWRRS